MQNKCPFDPSAPPYDTAAIGMFHCPECGEMVLAGVPHLDYSEIYGAPNTASTPTGGDSPASEILSTGEVTPSNQVEPTPPTSG